MQPTSLISCGWFAALCDCAVERRVRRAVVRVVSVVLLCVELPVVVVVVRPDGVDEVRPAGSDVDCPGDVLCVAPLLVLCAPTIAVQPISTAMTAESPARFIGCLLLVRPER